jgi:hypothetical protein
MIEIDVVRKIVHSDPLNRFATAKAGTDRLEIRTLCPDLLVAIHASVGGGDPCRCGSLYGSVAIAAIDAVVAYVMLVAKLDWLLTLDPLSSVPGGTIDLCRYPKHGEQNEDSTKDA